MISLEAPQANGPHLAWMGEPPGFSRVAAGALDLRWGPQGPALISSGKASPHASCLGASRNSSPVNAGALYLVWSRCWNLRITLQCLHGSWGTSGVSQVSQSSSLVGAFMCTFLQSCSSSVTLPFARIQGSLALSGGFPTMLFHEDFPQGCPTCHLGVSRSSA